MLQLSYTAHDLAPFARDLGFDGPPFVWDAEETSATADTPLAYTGVLDRELGDVEAEFATLRDGDLANAARKAKGLPGIELPEHAPMGLALFRRSGHAPGRTRLSSADQACQTDVTYWIKPMRQLPGTLQFKVSA